MTAETEVNNQAFIDGQNLYMSTQTEKSLGK